MTDRLRVLPGLRLNYDEKSVDYDAQVYGGLQTSNPALIALQRSVLAPLAYQASADDTNVSGQLTLAYAVTEDVNAYATYSTAFKSVGLNLGGIPNDASGVPAVELATVKPEDVKHIEAGVKTEFWPGSPRTSPPTGRRSRTIRYRWSMRRSACCAAILPMRRRCVCRGSSLTAARGSMTI